MSDQRLKPDMPNVHTHEKGDVGLGNIIRFLVILFASVFAIYVVLGGFWRYLGRRDAAQGTIPSPFSGQRELPPSPRLQVTPWLEWEAYQNFETRRLSSYGWVNKEQGTVRIPLDRAMDLIAQRGLPSRPVQLGNSQVEKNQPKNYQQQNNIRLQNKNEPTAH